MREILILAIHLLVTLAKLLRPGGVRAVAAESLLLKHQLLISNRSRQRAPNLTSVDRFVLGLATLFVRPHRLPKLGVLVRPATLLKFHGALVERKYRRLFSSSTSPRRIPGPKGPSAELIAAIIDVPPLLSRGTIRRPSQPYLSPHHCFSQGTPSPPPSIFTPGQLARKPTGPRRGDHAVRNVGRVATERLPN